MDAGHHPVRPPRQRAQHRGGARWAVGLAEHAAVEDHLGVGRDHEVAGAPLDGVGLGAGEAGDGRSRGLLRLRRLVDVGGPDDRLDADAVAAAPGAGVSPTPGPPAGQPPETARSARRLGGSRASGSSSQPSGSFTGRGPVVWPRCIRIADRGNGRFGSSSSSRRVELGEGRHGAQGGAQRTTDGEALEVPAGVLAELLHAGLLTEPLGQHLAVRAHHLDDLAERRRCRHRLAGEGSDEVPEQPRAAEAAPADHHAVAAGGAHHLDGVGRLPDVAVAEDRDGGDRLLELGDGRPVGHAGVQLLGGPGVHGDRGGAGLLGEPAGHQPRAVLVVEADAHLHRDRHVAGAVDRSGDHGAEQRGAQRQRRATAVAGDLAGRGSRSSGRCGRRPPRRAPGGPPRPSRRGRCRRAGSSGSARRRRSGRCGTCARCPRPRPGRRPSPTRRARRRSAGRAHGTARWSRRPWAPGPPAGRPRADRSAAAGTGARSTSLPGSAVDG